MHGAAAVQGVAGGRAALHPGSPGMALYVGWQQLVEGSS